MNKIDESDWKEDETEFWFGNILDSRESRNKDKYEEKYENFGIGTITHDIESTLRKHKKELDWKEPETRGKKSRGIKYKKFDLFSGYENGVQWFVRLKISSNGKIWTWVT